MNCAYFVFKQKNSFNVRETFEGARRNIPYTIRIQNEAKKYSFACGKTIGFYFLHFIVRNVNFFDSYGLKNNRRNFSVYYCVLSESL